MGVMQVMRAGLSTTLQDMGRIHHRHLGVAVGGAMDCISHAVANRLVGNSPEQATLEMTLLGDELLVEDDAVVALTGPDAEVTLLSEWKGSTPIQGKHLDARMPKGRPVLIRSGTRLRIGALKHGCRVYLAVAGGWDVDEMLGSRSTLLRSRLGGLEGRKLQRGDRLFFGRPSPIIEGWMERQKFPYVWPRWFVQTCEGQDSSPVILRALAGDHWGFLEDRSKQRLWNDEWLVTSQSDRMGYRLQGVPLRLQALREMFSEGLIAGTLQLPPSGQPILIMADGAPTGGYPRIAHVISADLPKAAQLRPGSSFRLIETSLEEAQDAYVRQRGQLEAFRQGIQRHWEMLT